MAKITVQGLKYRYPLADKLALDDISFSVDEGECLGVIGRNASGKSTLCQAIIGLVPHFYKGAYGGWVIVDGIEVRSSSVGEVSRKAGIVFQNPFTQVTGAKRTVYEEVAFGLEHLGVARDEIRRRVDEALTLLNIYAYKDRRPFDLSGGQMQRMAIAGIFAMKPGVIILDEPTSQLDPQGAGEVFSAVAKLRNEGITIVIVEHKMEKLAEYCDSLLLLHDGKYVDYGSPNRIFSRADLDSFGISPPVYTRVCKRLSRRLDDAYPVTLDNAYKSLAL